MEESRLVKLLKWADAGNTERSRMVKKESFKKTVEGKQVYNPHEKKFMDSYKALITAENQTDGAYLIQEEVHKTVLDGAEPFKCFREILPILKTDAQSMRIVMGESGTYADKIAEGAKIDIDTQTYSKRDVSVDKYGTRPIITQEMLDDSLFNVAEIELKKAGARLENTLNRQCLYALLQGDHKIATANSIAPEGTHIAVSDIANAIGYIRTDNFTPDKLITTPAAEGYLLQDSNLAYVSYAGTNAPLWQGVIPKLMGLTPYTCSATEKATGYKWMGTTSGTSIYAMVLDSTNIGAIVMRKDIAVKQYEDPIHDLLGMSCTMRFGVDGLFTNAGCTITYK